MSSTAGFRRIALALRERNFRIYITGNAVSLVGTWMQRIAVGWLTWELTRSGFWLGLVACADLLPAVLVGPFGGVLADRLDRLRIILAVQAAGLAQATLLFAVTAAGAITVELLAFLVLLNGLAVGLYQPSRLALINNLLPRDQLATGIAINSIAFNLARFLGPALAGLLILTVGVEGAFGANAASFAAFLVAISQLRLEPADRVARQAGHASVLAELAEGIGYAVRHPGIGPMLLLLAIASLGLRPFVELMPGFAAEVFRGDADTLALLSSSVGIGAMAAGALMAGRGGGGLTRLVLVATALLACAILGFVATATLWLATLCAAFAGMCMVAGGISMQTLMQLAVEGAMRGRVLSLYSIVFIGGPAAGALVMGVLSELVGLRWPLAGGAALVLLVWLRLWSRRGTIATALEPDGAGGSGGDLRR